MEEKLYGWLLRSLIALAKRKLAEANKACGDNWPNGQEWHELGQSSKETFMSQAREEAGISTREYREFQQANLEVVASADLDNLWATGELNR